MSSRAVRIFGGSVGLLLFAAAVAPALAADPKGTPAVKKDAADTKAPVGAAAKAPGKTEPPAKAEASPAPAKLEKASEKTSAKAPEKTSAKAPEKTSAKASDEPEAADVDDPAGAEKTAKPKAKAPAQKKPAVQKPRVGEGPSPAMPPPLTIGGLRDEVRREAGPVTIDPSAPPRTKVEQMLAEITKTREALRDATSRLEGLLGDSAEAAPAGAGASGAAAGAGAGKPAAKNPLDVLAKALRGIKPELAAPIVARLDRRLAATVLLRMPPVDAGKIMGALKPDTAAELATQISMRVEVKR